MFRKITFALVAGLALCSLAVAQSPIKAFPPGVFSNKAASDPPAVTPPSYSYRSALSATGSGALLTGSVDIGTAAADRLVIVGFTCQNAPAITSVVVNGASLSNALTNTGASPGAYLYSGLVTSGSGAQTVTITFATGTFLTRTGFVWIANGLSSNSPKHVSTTPTNVTAATINVDAGDFLFAVTGVSSGTPNYTGNSTENPAAARQQLTGALSGYSGDWTVASTNASFSINDSASGDRVAISFR